MRQHNPNYLVLSLNQPPAIPGVNTGVHWKKNILFLSHKVEFLLHFDNSHFMVELKQFFY